MAKTIKLLCVFLCLFSVVTESSAALLKADMVRRVYASERDGGETLLRNMGNVLGVFSGRNTLDRGVGRGEKDLFVGKTQRVVEPVTIAFAVAGVLGAAVLEAAKYLAIYAGFVAGRGYEESKTSTTD